MTEDHAHRESLWACHADFQVTLSIRALGHPSRQVGDGFSGG